MTLNSKNPEPKSHQTSQIRGVFLPRRDQGRCDQVDARDRWCERDLTRRRWRWWRAETVEGFSFKQSRGFDFHTKFARLRLWFLVGFCIRRLLVAAEFSTIEISLVVERRFQKSKRPKGRQIFFFFFFAFVYKTQNAAFACRSLNALSNTLQSICITILNGKRSF